MAATTLHTRVGTLAKRGPRWRVPDFANMFRSIPGRANGKAARYGQP
jgi:hypothetical protein